MVPLEGMGLKKANTIYLTCYMFLFYTMTEAIFTQFPLNIRFIKNCNAITRYVGVPLTVTRNCYKVLLKSVQRKSEKQRENWK